MPSDWRCVIFVHILYSAALVAFSASVDIVSNLPLALASTLWGTFGSGGHTTLAATIIKTIVITSFPLTYVMKSIRCYRHIKCATLNSNLEYYKNYRMDAYYFQPFALLVG